MPDSPPDTAPDADEASSLALSVPFESLTPLRGMLLALLLPLAALALQWTLWDYIRPYVWFLFYPAVFFASWAGGLAGGTAATLFSALLVLFFFIPPTFSFMVAEPAGVVSVAMFLGMGLLFSLGNQHSRDAIRRAAGALRRQQAECAEAEEANARLRMANAELAARCARADELDALKTRFFANISHELRTPLTLLLGPLERLLAETPEGDGHRNALSTMLRNARLLHQHVDDMLDLSRVDAGAMQPRHAEADLSALTRTICAYFDTLADQRGIRYGVQAPLRLDAQVDTDKYRRILLNLLSNAFKFIPDGGSVSVTLERQGGEALLSVSDDGPGVPAHLRDAVFERYRQSGEGARGLHGGSGLGLAIVKEFAELHGGSASVGQGAEGGALFLVRLPLTAPPGVE
ncbi:sensor histidine kinase, partial [Nitratidesulfovibrio liaohensis]|uniref:sensor histidine kinase n=1 Tax=Nitratidesulfovibrio liaohensis TaxID=2604158 RepID=UPI001FB89EC5